MSDRGVQGRKKNIFREWLKSIQQLFPKSALSSLHIYFYTYIFPAHLWSQSKSHIDTVQLQHPWGILKTRSSVCSPPYSAHKVFSVSPHHHHSSWSVALPGSHTAPPAWLLGCLVAPTPTILSGAPGPVRSRKPSASPCSCVMPQIYHVGHVS